MLDTLNHLTIEMYKQEANATYQDLVFSFNTFSLNALNFERINYPFSS